MLVVAGDSQLNFITFVVFKKHKIREGGHAK